MKFHDDMTPETSSISASSFRLLLDDLSDLTLELSGVNDRFVVAEPRLLTDEHDNLTVPPRGVVNDDDLDWSGRGSTSSMSTE
jgi:hypothetical protein